MLSICCSVNWTFICSVFSWSPMFYESNTCMLINDMYIFYTLLFFWCCCWCRALMHISDSTNTLEKRARSHTKSWCSLWFRDKKSSEPSAERTPGLHFNLVGFQGRYFFVLTVRVIQQESSPESTRAALFLTAEVNPDQMKLLFSQDRQSDALRSRTILQLREPEFSWWICRRVASARRHVSTNPRSKASMFLWPLIFVERVR